MATINISLPDSLAMQLDEIVNRFAYSNRSEFIRSLLRRVFTDDSLLQESAVFPFKAPVVKSKKKIIDEFVKTKKYSKNFIKDLDEGLSNSRYFQE